MGMTVFMGASLTLVERGGTPALKCMRCVRFDKGERAHGTPAGAAAILEPGMRSFPDSIGAMILLRALAEGVFKMLTFRLSILTAAGVLSLGLSCACVGSQKLPTESQIDHDLFEATIPQLERFYRDRRYTVTEVVRWHLARIHRYNAIYKAVEQVLEKDALETAAREDAELARGGAALRGPLWGVPVVIKANTCIAAQVTTDGWEGYTLPGHEFLAPRDATVVAKLRAAGAVLIGHTNMPDFANSDTNRSSSFGRTGNAYDVRFCRGAPPAELSRRSPRTWRCSARARTPVIRSECLPQPAAWSAFFRRADW